MMKLRRNHVSMRIKRTNFLSRQISRQKIGGFLCLEKEKTFT